jgi:hypothetical protein
MNEVISLRELENRMAPTKEKTVLVTVESMLAVIERHQLPVDRNGDYRINDALIAEAQAIDLKEGRHGPLIAFISPLN